MPANVYDTNVNTYSRDRVKSAIASEPLLEMHVKLAASLTLPKGAILAEKTDTPGLYALVGTSGYGNGRCVLPVAVTTDSNNLITVGSQPANRVNKVRTIEAIFGGYVRCQDVDSLDATYAGHLGKITRGTVSDGILHIF